MESENNSMNDAIHNLGVAIGSHIVLLKIYETLGEKEKIAENEATIKSLTSMLERMIKIMIEETKKKPEES